jgi:hypothetical protein
MLLRNVLPAPLQTWSSCSQGEVQWVSCSVVVANSCRETSLSYINCPPPYFFISWGIFLSQIHSEPLLISKSLLWTMPSNFSHFLYNIQCIPPCTTCVSSLNRISMKSFYLYLKNKLCLSILSHLSLIMFHILLILFSCFLCQICTNRISSNVLFSSFDHLSNFKLVIFYS